MRHVFSILTWMGLWAMLAFGNTAVARAPLKALIITSPGIYHDYEYQTHALAHGIVQYANVEFDVSLAELGRWKATDYSRGYDVLIYNMCMADNTDAELIANMRRQTEEVGTPALFIHCTMHTFRETDAWWPLTGLKSKAHEALRPLPQEQLIPHPILTGIAPDWVVGSDELYLNLEFDAEPLLASADEDGETNFTAWITYHKNTPLFGTTLGHSDETLRDPQYQRLIANALLFVTGNLTPDGKPTAGLEPDGEGLDIFDNFSAPEGVKFLDADGKDCAFRRIALAAGPCYLRCILNPLEWGEETRACKAACESEVPDSQELIAACTPDA